MKHLTAIFVFALIPHLSASAAVPLKWTVETSRAQPATFEAYQGETLTFEAALQSYGKPLEAPLHYAFYWQTNGMGSAYWSAPCTVPGASSPRGADTNTLRATWLPSYDVGAKAYNCFIGLSNSIYHAAFQLRLRPSPGALPNELPLPQKVIDFSQVTVLNPPWSGGVDGVDTNAVIDIANATIATNATISAITSSVSTLTSTKLDKSGEGGSIEWDMRSGTPSIPVLLVNSHLNIETGKSIFLEDADAGLVNTFGDPILADYAKKAELGALFSLTSTVSRLESTKADEFTEWTISADGSVSSDYRLKWYEDGFWELLKFEFGSWREYYSVVGTIDDVYLDFDYEGHHFTATRKRVLRTGDVEPPADYAAVSNAAMNAISTVTNADANLIYTITSDGAEPRFYFTPVGAIDPED